MKITCPACNANYRLPDEKIQGKNRIFKINCKRCGAEIRVRGVETADEAGRTTLPFALDAAVPSPTPAAPIWFCGIDGKQVGPLTQAEVSNHILAGRLGPDDLVWRKGFEAWKPVRAVQPFDELVAGSPATGTAGTHGRAPRRAQTLELSSAMIELLVKLDNSTNEAPEAQQTAVTAPSKPAAVVSQALPPELPAEETAPTPDVNAIAPVLPPRETGPKSGVQPARTVSRDNIKIGIAPRDTHAQRDLQAAAETAMPDLPVDTDVRPLGVLGMEEPGAEPPAIPQEAETQQSTRTTVEYANQKSAANAGQKPIEKAGAKAAEAPKKAEAPAKPANAGAAAAKAPVAAAKPDAAKPVAGATAKAPAKKAAGPNWLVVGSLTVVGGVIATIAVMHHGKSEAPDAAAEAGAAPVVAAAEPVPAPAPTPAPAPVAAPAPVTVAAADAGTVAEADAAAEAQVAATENGAANVAAAAGAGAEGGKAVEDSKAAEEAKAKAKAADEAKAKQNDEVKAKEEAKTKAAEAKAKEEAAKADAKAKDQAKAAAAKEAAAKAKAAKEEADAKRKAAEERKSEGKKSAAEKAAAAKAEKAEKAKADRKAAAEAKAAKANAAKQAAAERAENAKKAAAEKAEAAKKAAADKEAAKQAAAAKVETKAKSGDDDEIERILAKQKSKETGGAKTVAKAEEPEPVKEKAESGPALTQAQIDAVGSRASQKINRCYMLYADVDGGEEMIKVQLMVNSDGTVASSKVQGKHAADQVGKCISEAVKILTFPQSSGTAKKYMVRYTVGG